MILNHSHMTYNVDKLYLFLYMSRGKTAHELPQIKCYQVLSSVVNFVYYGLKESIFVEVVDLFLSGRSQLLASPTNK